MGKNIEQYNYQKESKEQIIQNTKEELEKLSIDTLKTKLKEIAPIYNEEINKLTKQELIYFYNNIILTKQTFGDNFYKLIFKGKEINGFKLDKKIPLENLTAFFNEVNNLLAEYEIPYGTQIILTLEELKQLTQSINSNKFKEILKKEFEENISLSEAISNTKLAKQIETLGKNPYEIIKTYENTLFKLLQNEYPNISPDTLKNISTGILLTMIKLINQNKINKNESLNQLKNIKNILKIKNTSKDIKKLLDNILNNEEISKNSEKYYLLNNPNEFSNLLINYINEELNEENILKEILNSKNQKLNKKEILKQIKKQINKLNLSETNINLLIKTTKILKEGEKNFSQIKNFKTFIKKELIEKNFDDLKEIKQTLEQLGIWNIIKPIINFILKLLGIKGGWEELEKNINKEKYKKVIEYFKTLENQIPKEHIFSEGIKENINQIEFIGKLNEKTLKFLNKQNLNEFFKSNNFKNFLKTNKISWEDFKKQLFKYETKTNLNILKINLNALNNIIENKIEKDIKQAIKEISQRTDVPKDVIYAIWKIESNLAPLGTVPTRFEEHIYNKYIQQGYDENTAKKLATSWGPFQIMGFNYGLAGYKSLDEFIKAIYTPQGQIDSIVNFINNNPQLKQAMQTKNWNLIAKYYNGPLYYKNNYHTKLAKYSQEYIQLA